MCLTEEAADRLRSFQADESKTDGLQHHYLIAIFIALCILHVSHCCNEQWGIYCSL